MIIFQCFLFSQRESVVDSLINVAETLESTTQGSIEEYVLWKRIATILETDSSTYKLAEVNIGLGDYFYSATVFEEALNYYLTSERFHNTLSIPQQIQTNLKTGDCFYQLERIQQATNYWERAINLSAYPQLIQSHQHVIDQLEQNNDFKQSLLYLNKLENILIDNSADNSTIFALYNNLAFAYHQENKLDSAILYFDKSIDSYPNLPEAEKLLILQNKAIAHINQGNTNEGLNLLLTIYDESENQEQLAEISQILGLVYSNENDYLKALTYYKESENKYKSSYNSDIIANTYFGLSTTYNNIHEYDLAYDYIIKYKSIIDSTKLILELEKERLINQKDEIERAEKQNQLFRATQKVQQAEIQKLLTETKNQQLKTESLQKDSINRVVELNLALREKEVATTTAKNAELELVRLSNLSEIAQQQLSIAKANQEKIELERQKQEKENELEIEKLVVQRRNEQIKNEQNENKLKAQEIVQRKKSQRNTLYFSGLLGLLAALTIGAYYIKKRDNDKLESAYNDLSLSESRLKSAEVKIKTLLKQQVSGPIAQALIDDKQVKDIQQKFVAILFLDIRGYTNFCETKTPAEIIAYQNEVFGFMINIIEKYNGVVNQLLGDGFMATFGAPVSSGNDSLNAYKAAIEIKETLQQKNDNKEIHPTKVGMGIHAGNVVAGNVGNEERKQYSISGNTVILAARLEQLNKQYSSTLIYSKELYDQLPIELQTDITFESVMVKGRSQPIEIAVS